MIAISCLNKKEKDQWLPRLFGLLYENMHRIAPSGLNQDQEREQWLSQVSPALDKEPRQILMCFADGELVGYLQYYTRNDLLMIEEVQISRQYQRTFVFYRLCKYLLGNLSKDIRIIEAYADKRNHASIKLMGKLGMVTVEEDESAFIHMRGSAQTIRTIFTKGAAL
ncbi:MAG: GNAT family N-acetyltransferase [Oscillospiraceae bacterium]|nr:GNAT family N-acetyltransferase [Oscillospiraceae bacterium]